MLREFHGGRVLHVKREANSAAHTLAKLAVIDRDEMYWMEEFPPNIMAIVAKECYSLQF